MLRNHDKTKFTGHFLSNSQIGIDDREGTLTWVARLRFGFVFPPLLPPDIVLSFP
jgi:hypothetical protein